MSIFRLFAYLILSLAALIFIVLPVTAITLAHSNAGSQWLVNTIKPRLPKTVSFTSFEGSLAGDMRLEQLQVSTPTFSAQLDYVALDWNPWRLIEGELAISTLTLGSGEIRVRQGSTTSDTNSVSNIESVAVTPPIAVSINDLQLNKSWLFINELPQQQVAFSGALALSTKGKLSVTSFALRHQYLSVTSTMSAMLSYPFDYQLDSTVTLHSPDYPKTSLELHSAGDIIKLDGDFTVTDSIDANGQFSASDLLSSLKWDATTQVSQTRINDWLTALGAPQIDTVSVRGKLKASGTKQTLFNAKPSLTVTYQGTPIHINGATTLTQQQLLFNSFRAKLSGPIQNGSASPIPVTGAVEISGSVDLRETPLMDVELTLSEVNYQQTTSNGTISVLGPLAELSINADTVTHLNLNEPNTIKTHAKAVLSPSQLRVEKLTINDARFSGQVVGTATVDWQSDLTIRSDLTGQLFNEPFSLLANVTYNAPYLTVKQLSAQWRQSHISASGRMAPGSQLSLSAQIADLKQLPMPIAASGDINLAATVEGDLTAPWFDITINSKRLSLAGTDITDSTATITGDLSKHEVTARATALATQWQIRSTNTVDADRISLNVDEFFADHESLEPLQLHGGPATIDFQWTDNRLSVASLCFMQAQLSAPACIDATTKQSMTTVKVNLPATHVALFHPFIAGAPFNLEGTINASAQAAWSWKASDLASVEANVSSSNLVLHGLEESIAIDQVTLELTPERDHFTLTLNARANDIGLTAQGHATLQQLSVDTSLTGSIETTLKDIALLQVVVPAVSSAEGQLTANLAFSGSPQRLTLRPKAHAQIDQLVLSETGTLIKQAELHLLPTPQQSARFALNGSGQIGEGTFTLEGAFDIASTTLDATLQGNNLHVLDTPKVSVIVSPDLNVTLAQNKLSVTGSVNVPTAHISPPQLSDVQRPSSDVVIKQQPQEATSPLSTYANITLSLGDNVNVSAYGFDGQLQGTLNIIQADAGVARGNGTIGVKTGTYEIYGQELSIDRGELVYNGGPLSNPSLNLQVVRNLPDATASPERVGARVQGTLQEPTLTLFSEPPMPDSSILSYLMFGRAPNSSAESSNLELQAALLLTGDMTNSVTQSLKDTFGFDEVAIDSATSDVNDTSLYIGKYITPRLYIKYGIGLIESTSSFFLRYQLTEHLWIESTSSTESQGGDLIYSIEK